mgnify:CR=1 FL=1
MRIVADTSSVDDQLLRDLTRIIDDVQRRLPDVDIDLDIDTTGLTRLRDETDDTDVSMGSLFATVGRVITSVVRFTAVGAASTSMLVGLSSAIAGTVAALGGLEGIANQAVGGLAVILAARGVLQVALSGISEAFDALGADSAEFEEAISGLAPSAQSIAREFRAAVPAFTSFRNTLQEALFAEIAGEESAARLAGTLRQLTPNAAGVARQFGQLADGLIDLVTAPRIVEDLNTILASTGTILDRVIPKVIDFVDGAITRAAAGTTEFGETFGVLKDFADAAGEVFSDIGRIFSAIGEAAAGTGAEIGGPLAAALDLVADTLGSPIGQEFLRTLFELAQTITNALLPAAGELLAALAAGLVPVIEQLAPILGEVAGLVADFVVEGIVPLLPLIGELAAAFLGALGPALSIVSALLTTMVPIFTQFYTAILPSLVPLIDALVVALDELAKPLADIAVQLGPPLADLFAALAPLIVATVEATIPLIPVITELALAATDLATDISNLLVPAIEFVAALLRGDFTAAGQAAQDFFRRSLDLIVGYFVDLPRRLIASLDRLGLVLFQKSTAAGERMNSAIRAKISSALDSIARLPLQAAARLGNLGATLYNSGRALVGGFIDGILSRIGDLKDAAGSILGAARDFFPGSPAKVGPFSGSGYTTHSGAALMDDFIAAVSSRTGALRDTVATALAGAQMPIQAAVSGSPAAALGRPFAMASTSPVAPSVSVYVGNEAMDRYVQRIVVDNDQANARRRAQGVRR